PGDHRGPRRIALGSGAPADSLRRSPGRLAPDHVPHFGHKRRCEGRREIRVPGAPMNKEETNMPTTNEEPGARWWKHGHVWLVIAGPAAVVVAGALTVWIAVARRDAVVAEDYYRRGMEINNTLREKALMPAVQGRNHAATPAQAR